MSKHILTCLLIAACRPGFAQNSLNEPRIQWTASFDVTLPYLPAKGLQVRQIISVNDSLYFWLSSATSTRSGLLVRTDLRGARWSVLSLGPNEVLDLAVDGLNHIFVWSIAERSRPTLEVLDDHGQSIGPPREEPQGPGYMVSSGSGVFGIGRSSVARIGASGISRARLDVPPLQHVDIVFPLPPNKVAEIDQSDAELRIIDTRSNTGKVVSLQSDELMHAKTISAGISSAGRSLVVIAATAGENGSIYVMPSGFTPEEGIPISILDAAGNLRGTIRCALPRGANSKIFTPFAIAVAEGRLYVSDIRGQVFVYPLPTQ